MIFADLSPFDGRYSFPLPQVYCVGWLNHVRDVCSPPSSGGPSASLLQKLQWLTENERVLLVRRAPAPCRLCRSSIVVGPNAVPLGTAQIWIPRKEGGWYASPDLLHHYIVVHGYVPPHEYVAALEDLDTTEMGDLRKRVEALLEAAAEAFHGPLEG